MLCDEKSFKGLGRYNIIRVVRMSADPTFIAKNGKSRTYWVRRSLCYYNAFYNTYFLNNEKTHRVRCGELFYKGEQKTDGEVEWKVKDFNYDLSNAHFWVETDDGCILDWIVSFFGKRDLKVEKKVWTKEEVKALGIEHRYYDNEEEVFKRGFALYGDASDEDRSQ